MQRDNFISQILQIVSFLSAIVVALSQYIFRDHFKIFFGTDSDLYNASSLVALILSLIIMAALFSKRYYLTMKLYFRKKKRDLYFQYLNKKTTDPSTELVKEPFSITISQMAALSILIALVAFIIMVKTDQEIIKSVGWIAFVCLIIFSLTTFAIQLYLENDFILKNEAVNQKILEKIREYFVGDLKINFVSEDRSNAYQPLKVMQVERSGKIFVVRSDLSNPEKFFQIYEPMPQPAQQQNTIQPQ